MKLLLNFMRKFYGKAYFFNFFNTNLGKFILKKIIFRIIPEKILNIDQFSSKFKIHVKPSRGLVDVTILMRNTFEPEILNVISKNISKGDIFLDIGANIGFISLFVSNLIGRTGKILAFEPVSITNKILRKNISLNNFTNIKKYNFGCGLNNEELIINVDRNNLGLSSFNEFNNKIKKEKIKIIKLDEFKPIKKLKKIDFIKIDIEGFEFEAFKGMMWILKKYKPKLIFEFSPNFYKDLFSKDLNYCRNFLTFLKNLNYEIYIIKQNGSLLMIKDIKKLYIKNKLPQYDLYCEIKK